MAIARLGAGTGDPADESAAVPALRAAVAFGLGETVLSYTLFLLGMAGGLRFRVLVPSAVLGSILCAPLFYRESRISAPGAALDASLSIFPAAGAEYFHLYILAPASPSVK